MHHTVRTSNVENAQCCGKGKHGQFCHTARKLCSLSMVFNKSRRIRGIVTMLGEINVVFCVLKSNILKKTCKVEIAGDAVQHLFQHCTTRRVSAAGIVVLHIGYNSEVE